MNRVDNLKREIYEIQSSCNHTYELTSEPPELVESLVSGVYLGELKGPARLSKEFYRNVRTSFNLKCTKCSRTINTNAKLSCPHCFSKMKVSEYIEGCEREKYFGISYIYYGIVCSTCTNPECRLTVANDEWDQ